MALDKEFFDKLDILRKCKAKPNLSDFFEAVDKLERLGEKINDEKHESLSDKYKLEQQAQGLTKNLGAKKEAIATLTKTQVEYDAVYECIDYLDCHFNSSK